MPKSTRRVRLIHLLTPEQRAIMVAVHGKNEIYNAQVDFPTADECADRLPEWSPPTREEIRKEEQRDRTMREMRQKSTGRLGSET